jgi:putative PIN family toxin of toxin-antitoxin system
VGKKEETVRRVVLDTNVLVSSLLFKGETARLVGLWKKGAIVPVVSRETFEEFRTVLLYPKFKLTRKEIKFILEEEVLPYFEVVSIADEVDKVCNDPDDDKFIACALSAGADFIVSGDEELCDVARYRTIEIIRVSDLLRMFD